MWQPEIWIARAALPIKCARCISLARRVLCRPVAQWRPCRSIGVNAGSLQASPHRARGHGRGVRGLMICILILSNQGNYLRVALIHLLQSEIQRCQRLGAIQVVQFSMQNLDQNSMQINRWLAERVCNIVIMVCGIQQ